PRRARFFTPGTLTHSVTPRWQLATFECPNLVRLNLAQSFGATSACQCKTLMLWCFLHIFTRRGGTRP
ncbi:MAG: hypothetical protein ACLGIY_25900, partial [Betaproteobacteria bacterium]